jgi:hypothetical protein
VSDIEFDLPIALEVHADVFLKVENEERNETYQWLRWVAWLSPSLLETTLETSEQKRILKTTQ